MSSHSIAIVGSVALDTIETPFKRRENLIGGSATYATIAAGRSSLVYPVGIVGNDFPQDGFAIFQKYSADLSDFQTVKGRVSKRCFQWLFLVVYELWFRVVYFTIEKFEWSEHISII